jgi:hypothetical protein
MLRNACAALDRAERCASLISKQGELIRAGKGGLKENPLLRSEIANRSFVVKTLEKLGINHQPIRQVGRPGLWEPEDN